MTTAWDVATNWEWQEEHKIRVKGGQALYTDADVTKTHRRVLLWRLQGGETIQDGISVIRRYVHPDTEVELVKHVRKA